MVTTVLKNALTIAGSDSGGGAGILADIKTFSAFKVYGMAVVTAVTAQNSVDVLDIHPVPVKMIRLQLEAVLSDMGTDGIKTGMLWNSEVVLTVAEILAGRRPPFLIVDPIMTSKSGKTLLDPEAISVLKTALLPMASMVTPNIPEAEALTGVRIVSERDIRKAGHAIHRLGVSSVLVKGGHRGGPASDFLFDGSDWTVFVSERIDSSNTHGTGCTYSAAILANLVLGKSPIEAVRASKAFVTEAIRHAFPLGRGQGPLNHFVKIETD